MELLKLDNLFIIAEATPFLEQAEAELYQSGNAETARNLNKLMQDTGVQIDREMNGFDENEPAPGPQTAALNASYEPVTPRRLYVLLDAAARLGPHALCADPLNDLARSLPIPPLLSGLNPQDRPSTPSA